MKKFIARILTAAMAVGLLSTSVFASMWDVTKLTYVTPSNSHTSTKVLSRDNGEEHTLYIYPAGTVFEADLSKTETLIVMAWNLDSLDNGTSSYNESDFQCASLDEASVFTPQPGVVYLIEETNTMDWAHDMYIMVEKGSVPERPTQAFTDVPEDYWASEGITYVYGHGLMAGTSATTFAPGLTTTRGMIVTILYRLAGSPDMENEIWGYPFKDVDANAYYAAPIYWAQMNGIADGYSDELFGPDDPITREQMAAMLWRYAQRKGYDVSMGEDTNILSYTDVADLGEYAIPAMQWACGAGIINGTGDGSTLIPLGRATRAQAAVMLMRFCEEYVTW